MTLAVLDYIKSTPSIKQIFISSKWYTWMSWVSEHFNYTLGIYNSLGVDVYVIQSNPFQNATSTLKMSNVYKQLFNSGQLSDAKLLSVSTTRQQYMQQQASFTSYFTRFNRTRGFTVVYIQDFVCDSNICPIGTGLVPFYEDVNHMTWTFSRRLKTLFEKYVSL